MQWLIDIIVGIVNPIPIGSIVIWSGAEIDIPAGWQFCDGTNGTPDLRNRFVRCSGPFNPIGSIAGDTTHHHTGESAHHHHLTGGTGLGGGKEATEDTGTPHDVGDTGTTSTLPPYYTFAYIMKLS